MPVASTARRRACSETSEVDGGRRQTKRKIGKDRYKLDRGSEECGESLSLSTFDKEEICRLAR